MPRGKDDVGQLTLTVLEIFLLDEYPLSLIILVEVNEASVLRFILDDRRELLNISRIDFDDGILGHSIFNIVLCVVLFVIHL